MPRLSAAGRALPSISYQMSHIVVYFTALVSRKLHLLYLSLRYYTLADVWNDITAGMIDRDNGEAARMALSRWHRAASLDR